MLASPELFAVWLFKKKNVSSPGCTGAGGEAGAQTLPIAAPGPGSGVPAPQQLPTDPPPSRRMSPAPSPSPTKKHSPPPAPNGPAENHLSSLPKSNLNGKERLGDSERSGQVPSRDGGSGVGGGGGLSKTGRKSELQGNADSNAEKIRFQREAGSGARRGGPGRQDRSGAVGGGVARGARSRAGRAGGRAEGSRRGCRMLSERLARRDAGSEGRASWAASAAAPRCLEMDRLENQRACERAVLSGGERGKPREEELLSNNHLLPLSAIQGRNQIVLSFPWESSAGTEKRAGLGEKRR